jgi:periplasmic protein TonB
MYTSLEQFDRKSPPTGKFLIALLFSTISHAVAIMLADPSVTPATAPPWLMITATLTTATAASAPAIVPDNRAPGESGPVPKPKVEPVPKSEPEPVIKQARRTPSPVPRSHPNPAPAELNPSPAAQQRLTIAASSRPASPATSAAATATAVSREVEYLYNPPPEYPRHARRLGLEGEVLIRTRVLPNGDADEVVLERSSGYALLDQAAIEAVRTWRFRPARRGDEQIVSWVEIPVRFRLNR